MDVQEDQGSPASGDGPRNNGPSSSKGRAWIYGAVILCCYGFFKEFKPSEPFLTPFLVDYKNFTKDEVNSKVYPYWPYSYLVAVFFTFLFTDMLRYTPVILFESLAYLATRFLLIWGTSIMDMRWMQIVYGVATATEIAYFSYIYTAVSVGHFKHMTGCVRAVRLFGQSTSALLGQILLSTHVFNTLQLNYISLASVSLACCFAVMLPFSGVVEGTCCKTPIIPKNSTVRGNWLVRELKYRFRDFVKFYSQPSLLKWSVWWALAMCGVLQVGNYVQSLWKEVADSQGVSHDKVHEYNGVVEALATLCGAGAAALVSVLKVNWAVWGEVTIGVLSLLDALLLVAASFAAELWTVYLCHIVYRATYSFLITVASTQLALHVEHHSYALIFGFNTFLALILQTLLTLVVSDGHVLDVPIRTQFVVYSGYYYLLSLIFIGAGVYSLTSHGCISSILVCCRENAASANQLQGQDNPTLYHTNIQAHDEGKETDDPEASSLSSMDTIIIGNAVRQCSMRDCS